MQMGSFKDKLLSEHFDFDEASRLWKANKIYIGNGSYKYSNNCQSITKEGKLCKKKCKPNSNVCNIHEQTN